MNFSDDVDDYDYYSDDASRTITGPEVFEKVMLPSIEKVRVRKLMQMIAICY